MRQASKRIPDSAEKTVRGIRRNTRRHHSAEEKIRIVLEGLRGEVSIAGVVEALERDDPSLVRMREAGAVTAIPGRIRAMRSAVSIRAYAPETLGGASALTSTVAIAVSRCPRRRLAFLDTATVMMHLDLVVTSDTSIAHLAGALGREVFVALRKIPDWRFLLGRDDSPWYPSMRWFRQADAGNWRNVFERIAQIVREQTGPPAKQFALYSPWLQ